MQNEQDRRKLKRRHLIYYSRVYDRATGKLMGHLMDITPEGIKLISEEPIPNNIQFQFRMDLPEDIIAKPYMFFDALSVWCAPDINPDFYNTGFRVFNMNSKDAELIDHMIEEYGFRD
jgi:hypothetical protein